MRISIHIEQCFDEKSLLTLCLLVFRKGCVGHFGLRTSVINARLGH